MIARYSACRLMRTLAVTRAIYTKPHPTNQLLEGAPMIVDHRTYNVYPGKLPAYLEIYKTEGLPLQKKYLGTCVGWYVSTDIGTLNQVVHLWAYDSLADRAERRAALMKDAKWLAFIDKGMPFLQSMENKILTPTDFFDLDNTVKVQQS